MQETKTFTKMTKTQILKKFIAFLKEKEAIGSFIDNHIRQGRKKTKSKDRRRIFLAYVGNRLSLNSDDRRNTSQLVNGGFFWEDSPEGDMFWRILANEWKQICITFNHIQ